MHLAFRILTSTVVLTLLAQTTLAAEPAPNPKGHSLSWSGMTKEFATVLYEGGKNKIYTWKKNDQGMWNPTFLAIGTEPYFHPSGSYISYRTEGNRIYVRDRNPSHEALLVTPVSSFGPISANCGWVGGGYPNYHMILTYIRQTPDGRASRVCHIQVQTSSVPKEWTRFETLGTVSSIDIDYISPNYVTFAWRESSDPWSFTNLYDEASGRRIDAFDGAVKNVRMESGAMPRVAFTGTPSGTADEFVYVFSKVDKTRVKVMCPNGRPAVGACDWGREGELHVSDGYTVFTVNL